MKENDKSNMHPFDFRTFVLPVQSEQIEGLSILETNPYYLRDVDGDYYNKYPEFEIFEAGKQAQLEGDQAKVQPLINTAVRDEVERIYNMLVRIYL